MGNRLIVYGRTLAAQTKPNRPRSRDELMHSSIVMLMTLSIAHTLDSRLSEVLYRSISRPSHTVGPQWIVKVTYTGHVASNGKKATDIVCFWQVT